MEAEETLKPLKAGLANPDIWIQKSESGYPKFSLGTGGKQKKPYYSKILKDQDIPSEKVTGWISGLGIQRLLQIS